MDTQASIHILNNGNLCLEVPLIIKHKYGRRIIIAPETLDGKNPEAESPVQASMLQALARAHAWAAAIEAGEVKQVRHIAEKLNLDFSYVCQILHLVNLAPGIQEAIIAGKEPDGLSLAKLRCALPAEWNEQYQIFGIKG